MSAKRQGAYERWRRRPDRVVSFIKRDIWLLEEATLPRLQGFLTRISRVILITARGFFRERCLQQAAALTYSTIFLLPPMLAFAFAAAKGFNLYVKLKTEAIEPFLDATFGPRSEGAQDLRHAVDTIFDYVEKTDLTALGSFAFAFMLYSVIKMLSAVEGALNDIWGVKYSRSFVRRITDYLAIVVVAPALLLVALGLTTWLQNREIPLMLGGSSVRILPLLAVWFGHTFVYMTLPNTRVKLSSALVGGIAAGSIWQGVQILHLAGQIELARYNTIYASFAAIPMLLLWIYLSWSVFLIGGELAFAHQNEPIFTSIERTGKVDQAYKERIAPRLAGRVTAAFLSGKPAPTGAQLASDLGVAPRMVAEVLESLVCAKLLGRTSEDLDNGYLPARDPETITVLDLLHALRREVNAGSPPVHNKLDERVERILGAFDEELTKSLHNYTLSELARTLVEEERERQASTDATGRAAESPS